MKVESPIFFALLALKSSSYVLSFLTVVVPSLLTRKHVHQNCLSVSSYSCRNKTVRRTFYFRRIVHTKFGTVFHSISTGSINLRVEELPILIPSIQLLYYIALDDREKWWALVNVIMNLRVPQTAGNFLTSLEPVRFSRRTLLHEVSK
jgi:hypothetical protein